METALSAKPAPAGRLKFFIGGGLIIAAIIFLVVNSLSAPGSTQFYMTVDELLAKGKQMVGKDVRLSGAVIGDSIKVDPSSMTIRFTIVNIPNDINEIDRLGGIAVVLKNAVINPKAGRINVTYQGVKPDLLQDEAQAIMTGKLADDGVFIANELLLKCPSRYEEAAPQQSGAPVK
jgi:cytochrome c-type biogenesis protein CcmE